MTTALICPTCFDETGERVPTTATCRFCGSAMCAGHTATYNEEGAMCKDCEKISSKPKKRTPVAAPDEALAAIWLTEDAPLSKVVKTMNRQKAAEKLIRKHSGKYKIA